ncbi:MAG: hypothetical protein GY757_10220 [bacterium]|nr:hypothetical protein [bacterium]
MKIGKHYLAPNELIKCELKTLQFFKSNFFYTQELETMALYSNALYSTVKQNISRGLFNFNFESKFAINIDGNKGYAYVSALIETNDKNEFQNISYCFSIIGKEKQKGSNNKILRKFHFDYTPPLIKRNQPQPTYHLQYGGEATTDLKKDFGENCLEHMDTWLSEPRLFYSPVSLALLVNMIIKEFPAEKTTKLIRGSEWRSLIIANENLILAPFYKACSLFLADKDRKEVFSNDFYYVD